jgi:HEAT repeat protein
VEDLIRLLLEDCHDPVAQAAVRALGRLVPHSAKAAVPLAKRLTANLSDYPLVQILKRMGPSAAETVPVLIALLETDPRALVPVSEILAAIGPAAEAAVPVLAKFRPSTYVIDALAAIGTPAVMAVLAEWAVQIRSGKVRVAEEALSALATFGPAAAAMSPLLLEALGLPAVPGDKAALIRALGCIGPADRSAPVLTRLFRNDPHDEVRHAAGFALWKLGVREPDPLAEMLTLLRKPKGAVQGAAVSAVLLKIAGLAPAERAAEILPLLATWSEDWNDHRATNAILAVSAFGKAAAPLLPVLVERLRKYRVIARPSGYAFAYSAMTTLKVVNDLAPPATAVERLVPFLAVREPDAFGAVAAMLVAHGAAAEPAIPALEAAARLKQRDIREIAADALADIRRAVRAARSGPGRD